MTKILTLNKIAAIGLNQLDKAVYDIADNHENPEAILLRSASMHDMELPATLKAVGRAGAGVNNIPIDKCTEKGIVVFNTPGANANAVKELAICGLLLSSRKVVDGINWAQTLSGDDVGKQVEKGKAAFVGPEISGKKLGIIGLGAIGVLLANSAAGLGMEVAGFDPYISVDAAWGLSARVKKAASLKEIYETCDYISIHVPLNSETKGMFNSEVFEQTKKGVRILNFARAELVDQAALLKALEDGTVSCYVTDFLTEGVLRHKNIIPIPHLGASTPESEDNCAQMAVYEIKEYLEKGNIINSVNFPACVLDRAAGERVCIIHENIPNMLGQISSLFAGENINIVDMISKSRGNVAYTVVDVEASANSVAEKIKGIKEIISVRVIK